MLGDISGDNAHIQGSAHMFKRQLFERDPMEKDLGPEYLYRGAKEDLKRRSSWGSLNNNNKNILLLLFCHTKR